MRNALNMPILGLFIFLFIIFILFIFKISEICFFNYWLNFLLKIYIYLFFISFYYLKFCDCNFLNKVFWICDWNLKKRKYFMHEKISCVHSCAWLHCGDFCLQKSKAFHFGYAGDWCCLLCGRERLWQAVWRAGGQVREFDFKLLFAFGGQGKFLQSEGLPGDWAVFLFKNCWGYFARVKMQRCQRGKLAELDCCQCLYALFCRLRVYAQ